MQDAPPVDPDGRVGNRVAERLGQADETAATGTVRRVHHRDHRQPALLTVGRSGVAARRSGVAVDRSGVAACCSGVAVDRSGVAVRRVGVGAQRHAQQAHRAYVGVEEPLHSGPRSGGVEVAVRLGQHDSRGGEGDREIVQERLPLG